MEPIPYITCSHLGERLSVVTSRSKLTKLRGKKLRFREVNDQPRITQVRKNEDSTLLRL